MLLVEDRSSQNKNYVIEYLAWRITTGKHQEITLLFMGVGHTRCLVDGHFGLIRSTANLIQTPSSQMAEVVTQLSQ